MQREVLKLLRTHLAMDTHEVLPAKPMVGVFSKCIIKGGLSSWEQGAVAGYLQIRNEPYALVAYSERPYDGLPQFDFIPMQRLGKFRKVREREFTLGAPVARVALRRRK
jgi:hypothetical protein